MKTEIVDPILGNFISSLRDVGYTFEIAVADVLDNSIAAGASAVYIHAVTEPEISLAMLDNGSGMSEKELVSAMRLATRNPHEIRHKADLGRFGLGLKTASFSQCRRLTVISKKNNEISAKQWDLDLISKENRWLLISLDKEETSNKPLFEKLQRLKSGTLVLWEEVDRHKKPGFVHEINRLRNHLSLVFHRFLEGVDGFRKLKVFVNENPVIAFNPFNIEHPATQQGSVEKIAIYDQLISVQPFILPHHSKLSQQEYERYATEEGYTKSQGFYLYRANRLLIYGTWWGVHRAVDAYKLVRVKIDISNAQDNLWGIDIKKSTAAPMPELKRDLTRIIQRVTEKGSRTYSARGARIQDRTTIRFWQLEVTSEKQIKFTLNMDHPLLLELIAEQADPSLLQSYLAGVQAYLPLEAIQAQLQQNPHQIDQESIFTDVEIADLTERIRSSGLDGSFIEDFLRTEIYKSRQELLKK